MVVSQPQAIKADRYALGYIPNVERAASRTIGAKRAGVPPGALSCKGAVFHRREAVMSGMPIVGCGVRWIDAERFDDIDQLKHQFDLGQPDRRRTSPHGFT